MSKAIMVTAPETEPTAVEIVDAKDVFDRMNEIYERIQRRAYELFEGRGLKGGHDLDDWLTAERELLQPVPVELVQHDDKIIVRAQVPGFKEDDLNVSVDNRRLIITGKSEATRERDAEEGRYTEHAFNEVFRLLELPSDVDAKNVSVALKDGVLDVNLPKLTPAEPPKAA